MTTQPDSEPRVSPPDNGDDDELFHIMCCVDRDLGLCGVDLKDVPEVDACPAGDQDCVVCEDLGMVVGEGTKCPGCPTTMRNTGVWNGA